MKKYIITALLTSAFASQVKCQVTSTDIRQKYKSVAQMFTSMPDSILTYMQQNVRKQLIDIKNIEPDSTATIPTATGQATLTTMTDNILSVTLSPEVTLEIGRVDDNHYVVIKTLATPEKESTVFVCDSTWHNAVPIKFSTQNFFTDYATADQRNLVEFPLIEAHIAPCHGNTTVTTLDLSLNAPLLTAEDKKELDKYTMQRHVTWNGNTFQ